MCSLVTSFYATYDKLVAALVQPELMAPSSKITILFILVFLLLILFFISFHSVQVLAGLSGAVEVEGDCVYFVKDYVEACWIVILSEFLIYQVCHCLAYF